MWTDIDGCCWNKSVNRDQPDSQFWASKLLQTEVSKRPLPKQAPAATLLMKACQHCVALLLSVFFAARHVFRDCLQQVRFSPLLEVSLSRPVPFVSLPHSSVAPAMIPSCVFRCDAAIVLTRKWYPSRTLRLHILSHSPEAHRIQSHRKTSMTRSRFFVCECLTRLPDTQTLTTDASPRKRLQNHARAPEPYRPPATPPSA